MPDDRITALHQRAIVATAGHPSARKVLDLFPGTRILRPMIVLSTDPEPPLAPDAGPMPPAPITFDQKYPS